MTDHLIVAHFCTNPNPTQSCHLTHPCTCHCSFQRVQCKSNGPILRSSGLRHFTFGWVFQKTIKVCQNSRNAVNIKVQAKTELSQDTFYFFCLASEEQSLKTWWTKIALLLPTHTHTHSKRQILTIDVTINLNIPLTFGLNCGRCFLTHTATLTFVAFIDEVTKCILKTCFSKYRMLWMLQQQQFK